GLIQDEKKRVGLESLDEAEFALHPGAVFADAPAQIAVGEAEAFLKVASAAEICRLSLESGEQVEDFAAGEVGIDAQFAGVVSDVGARVEALMLAVVSEDEGLAGGGAEEVEEDADGGGLAGAV